MSAEIAGIIAAMEFAARQGLRHYLHDDGRTRIALWRDAQAAAPTRPEPAPAPPVPAAPAGDDATVAAPLPGLCHLAPDPASPPFVTPGERIEAGRTLCIIEAMKVMTAVPAPRAGTVARILAADGSAVAAGDPLMEIRP